jgi:hypothetical protein
MPLGLVLVDVVGLAVSDGSCDVVVVAVGGADDVDADGAAVDGTAADEREGVLVVGLGVDCFSVPPNNEVPLPFELETVDEIGCPEIISKAVTAPSVTRKSAAAERAIRFGSRDRNQVQGRHPDTAGGPASRASASARVGSVRPKRCATADSTAAARIRCRVVSIECW